MQAHPRCNVISGNNGQGKTNLLESLYLLATLRSFRTHRLEECIPFGQSTCEVQARVAQGQVAHTIEVEISQERAVRKKARIDGKTAKAMDFAGHIRAVLFVPEDLRLIKGTPSARRQFLDRAVFTTHPAYLKEVQEYEHVLRQRNAVLKAKQLELLPVYDQQLAKAGAVLVRRRREYVEKLSVQMAQVFAEIGKTHQTAGLEYRSSCKGWEEEQELLVQFEKDRTRDLYTGHTHHGPHTDDLEFWFDGHLAQVHASQGQTRALVLATKIAEIQHLEQSLGVAPVLLLDDVSSELDAIRTEQLFAFLRNVSCQTFITTTDAAYIPFVGDRNDYHMCEGVLTVDAKSSVPV